MEKQLVQSSELQVDVKKDGGLYIYTFGEEKIDTIKIAPCSSPPNYILMKSSNGQNEFILNISPNLKAIENENKQLRASNQKLLENNAQLKLQLVRLSEEASEKINPTSGNFESMSPNQSITERIEDFLASHIKLTVGSTILLTLIGKQYFINTES